MKIVHFSDWHGSTMLLPKADLYVCTGDQLPNFPTLIFRKWEPKLLQNRIIEWKPNHHIVDPSHPRMGRPDGDVIGRKIEPAVEKVMQELWIKDHLKSYRQFFASPDAPVVCVRGNHDFTDLAPAFGGDVTEIHEPEQTVEIEGLKIGGFRGIPFMAGEWSDEYPRDKTAAIGEFEEGQNLESICGRLPVDLDIVVSHTPPYGILDSYGHSMGSEAYATYVNRRNYVGTEPKPIKAACFGHIHLSHMTIKEGDTVFSNAATGFNTFEV